jgi:hypothetical protein
MSTFPDTPVGVNHSLYYLVRASGNSGASGQSFRNHVTGAATGVKMTDYIIHSWDATGLPDPGTTYNSGTTFNLALSFVQGTQAGNIKLTGNVVSVTSDIGFGGHISTSSSIVDTSSGSTCDITITSQFRADSIINVSGGYFTGYGDRSNQGIMPGDDLTHNITFFVDTSASGTAADHTVNLNLSYSCDLPTPQFNGFFSTGVAVNMHDRIAVIADFDSIQWSLDGGSTIETSTGDTFTYDELAEGDNTTVWYRARLTGGSYGSWTGITFDDTRTPV